jgi:hypothetical protein
LFFKFFTYIVLVLEMYPLMTQHDNKQLKSFE